MVSSKELVGTLQELVAIPSVNPAYEGGVPESAVALYVEEFFARRNVETFRQEVLPGRWNVIARVPGRFPGRRVVLEAHMDTVSVLGMSIPPFTPEVADGRLYGRGSCDTKAGLACMMHAVAEAAVSASPPPCEVWLAAVVDEEYSFQGVLQLCQDLTADAAIIAEPTEMRLVTASKGVLRWRVHTRGVAAHSAKPHLGDSAILRMAPVIEAFGAEHRRLAETRHPLLGPATLSIGTVQGGEQINLVPDRCTIAIDRRLLPGEDPKAVWQGYAELAASLNAEAEQPMLSDLPLETGADSHAARCAASILAGLGYSAEATGVPFGSDASKIARLGIPSLIFGPGSIDRAHTAAEYVELDQVEAAASFFSRFVAEFDPTS